MFGDSFTEFNIEINKISSSIPRLKEALTKLNDEIFRLSNYITRLQDDRWGGALKTKAQGHAFNKVSEVAKQTLHRNASEAIVSTKEYDFPGLGERLLNVINSDDKVITIVRQGKTARVRVNLNDTAGRLEEYAKAVKAAREELGVGKTSGKTASQMWAEKVYKVDREGGSVAKKSQKKGRGRGSRVVAKDVTEKYRGKYHRTIQARVHNFTNPAPWWSLLNNGNASGRLSGGSGGEPYPAIPPTKFVSKTIVELKSLYESLYNEEFTELTTQNAYSRMWAEGRIKDAQNLIVEIERLLSELEGANYEKALGLLEGQLDQFGEDRKSRADPEKLMKLAQDLAQGMEVGRRRLGHDVRIRTVLIERLMDDELRKDRRK